ncbi:MAG: hypothetical protein AAGB12_08660 [Pseudomonadota bacterium]
MKRLIYVLLILPTSYVFSADMKLPDETGGNFHDPERLVQNLPEDQAVTLNYQFSSLPLTGEAKVIPWVGGYWPKYLDSVNYRWDGENSVSAIEKYAEAFDVRDYYGNKANLEDPISLKYGIDGKRYTWPSPQACSTTNRYCGYGMRCAIRQGETEGVCTETWEGICHAWAAAAMSEPEPVNPVTINGVTFKINDIKALTTLMYTQGRQKNYMSYPCKKSDARGEIQYDQWGRPSADDFECADTNPGALHVIAANFLGIHQRSFVEDRIFDEQIWNQPVRGFDVLETRSVNAEEAMQLMAKGTNVFDVPKTYQFNDRAVAFQYVKMDLHYIAESPLTVDGNLSDRVDEFTETDRYEYLLELDAKGEIIGGEWLGRSKRNHPDFMTLTYGRSNQSIIGSIEWEDVKLLINQSVQ